ncbi:transcription initiation factor IIA subunit 2 [Aphelenchoides avenae]|nr:transcription initiation factor IIA subunit 2 [Aphelenchus avenae]
MSAKESTTHYQLYRSSTLGVALQSTLGEFIEDGKIDARLAEKVMLTFDKCINNALATRLVRTRRTDFRADKLVAYRHCNNVWTLILKDVEFTGANRPVEGSVDRLKIVACDAGVGKRSA